MAGLWQWVAGNSFAVLTAFVAVWGAALSTFEYFSRRQASKRRLKVTLAWGMLTYGPRLSDQMLLVTAANPGNRVVRVDGMALLLPDRSQAVVLGGSANPKLPCELSDGAKVMAWFDCHKLAIELRERGMTGVVKIRAVARDSLSTEHRSREVKFDIPRWLCPPRVVEED